MDASVILRARETSRYGWWVAVLVPAGLFVVLALTLYPLTLDDAFISFRYAVNLAQGNGLVFNPGERVEGFSNPLWVLLLAVMHGLGMDVPTAARIIGLLCGVLSLCFIARIAVLGLGFSVGVTFVMLCYLASNISVVYYATSGMETALYTCCILLMHYLLLERKLVPAGFACAAVVLLRPEGILYGLPLVVGVFLVSRSARQAVGVAAIPALAYLAYLGFRWFYFGELLPNTHAAKAPDLSLSLDSLLESLRAFNVYTRYRASVGIWILILAVLGFLAVFNRRTLPLGLSIGCAAFFVWYSQYDWMSFWRFYLPVLPLIVMFAFAPVNLLGGRLSRPYQQCLVLLLAGLLLVPNAMRTARGMENLQKGGVNPAMVSTPHLAIGRYLAQYSRVGDAIVVNEIGAIGYYSGRRIIDMLGLIDPAILPLLNGDDLAAYGAYVLAQNPAYILLNDKQDRQDTAMHPVHAAIFNEMQNTGDFVAGPVFPLNGYKNLLLFVRKDRVEWGPSAK